MRRLLTLVLAIGLSALVAVAVADVLRGHGDPDPPSAAPPSTTGTQEPPSTPPAWVEDRAGLGDRLERNGLRGSLYLSAAGCSDGSPRPLRVVRLPELELADGPSSAGCRFTVSAEGGSTAGPEATWSPSVPIFAEEARPGLLEVVDSEHPGELGLPGSTPAFKPDGSLTQMRSGAVMAWSNNCAGAAELVSSPVSFGPEEPGPYCSRTTVSRQGLRAALPAGRRLTSVDRLVWTDDAHLVAVLTSDGVSWLAPYQDGRSLGYANGLISRSTAAPIADPSGSYVALTPGGYLEVYDRDAFRVWASSVERVAFDWSPDGDWLAYAAADRNVYFLRTSDWTTRFSLQAATEGLAWR
jgi:hypothetical protein